MIYDSISQYLSLSLEMYIHYIYIYLIGYHDIDLPDTLHTPWNSLSRMILWAGDRRIQDAVADILQVRPELPWLSDGRIGFKGLCLIE